MVPSEKQLKEEIKMKKILVVLLIAAACDFAYENLFAYEYVTKEIRWSSNELLWEVANENVGPHEDVREVLCRIEKDNPGAKPGCILKVRVKVHR